jgi:hypothetical protein
MNRQFFVAILLSLAPILAPAQDGPPSQVLITNATVWDGTSDTATPGMNVLVENNLIRQISADPIPVNRSANTKIIGFTAENARKGRQVNEGADRMMRWVAEYELDAFGGSDLWPIDQLPLIPQDLVVRKRWFSDVEILRQNTSNAGSWLAKSGTKNPYREGPLGVIEVGAYADMILVDSNPLEDVSVFVDYETNIKVVIKDGEIYKNTLE